MEELDSEVIAKIRRLDLGDAAKCFRTLRPICRTLSMQRVVIGTVNLVKVRTNFSLLVSRLAPS